MEIRGSGHQVDVGAAFPEHVRTRLEGVADKYFSRTLSANVTLTRDGVANHFRVDCAMHVRQGVLMKASGEHADAHVAFDMAADRIEKQLRRYKRRLKNHHHNGDRDYLPAAYAVIKPSDAAAEELDDEDNPIIIAENQSDIPEVSVSDAVMMLDLRHTPALLFRNAGNGALSMVYRREDGNIGWVEPRDT